MSPEDQEDDPFALKGYEKKTEAVAEEAQPEAQAMEAPHTGQENESFQEFIKNIPWDELVAKYGTLDYVLIGMFWAMGTSIYFPTVFGAFARLLNDAGGALLAVPVVTLLELIPFGFLWLAARMVENGKAIPARLVALLPGILAIVVLQGTMFGMLGRDYTEARERQKQTMQEIEQARDAYKYSDY